MASCCKTALRNTISATYAITFLPGGSFFVAFDLQLYSAFSDDLQIIWFYSMARENAL